MTPEEVGERLVALLDAENADGGAVTAGVSGGGPGHQRAVVDVPVARWWAAAQAAHDPGALGCDFFDWLSAVDELDEGFMVVAHLWSSRRKHGLLLRARVPRDNPVVESVVDLYPGADWHERETYEMFGITFARHPDLRPLLLPPGFEGNPLRKEFVLASRVAKAWPGAKEPGESEAGTAKRAPMRPPGVPDPNEWGPLKGKVPPPERPERPARAARAPGERPARTPRAPGERPTRPPRAAAAEGEGEGEAPVAAVEGEAPASGERPARTPRAPGERPARPPRAVPAEGEPPVAAAEGEAPASSERTASPPRVPGERPPRAVPAEGEPPVSPAVGELGDSGAPSARPPRAARAGDEPRAAPPADAPPADAPPADAPPADAPPAAPAAGEPSVEEPPASAPPQKPSTGEAD